MCRLKILCLNATNIWPSSYILNVNNQLLIQTMGHDIQMYGSFRMRRSFDSVVGVGSGTPFGAIGTANRPCVS